MAGLGDQIMTLEGLGAAVESTEHDVNDLVPVNVNGVESVVLSDAHPGPRGPTEKELEQWRRSLIADWRVRSGDGGAYQALKTGAYDFRRYRDVEGKLVGKFYDDRSKTLRIKRISESPIVAAGKWMLDNCAWLAGGVGLVSSSAGESVTKACAAVNAARGASSGPPEPPAPDSTILGEVGIYPPGTVARFNVSRKVFVLYGPTLKETIRQRSAASSNVEYTAALKIARDLGPVRTLSGLGETAAPADSRVPPAGKELVGEEAALPYGVPVVGEEKDAIAWYWFASGAAVAAILIYWFITRRES